MADGLPLGSWPVLTQEQVMSPRTPGLAAVTAYGAQAFAAGTGFVEPNSGNQASGAEGATDLQVASGRSPIVTTPLDPDRGMPQQGMDQNFYGATQPASTLPRGPQVLAGARTDQSLQPMNGREPDLQLTALAVAAPEQLYAREAPNGYVQVGQVHHVVTEEVRSPRGSAQQSVVRWVSRLTEFLRTTAARSVDAIGDLGLMSPNGMDRPMNSPSTSVTRVRQLAHLGGTNQPAQRAIEVSPPEELGMELRVPESWSRTPVPRQPLFAQEQLNRLDEARDRAALLMGPRVLHRQENLLREEHSTDSSGPRAEIQHRLDEYTNRQQQEMKRLQQEIFNLRAEKKALEEGKQLGLAGPGAGQPAGHLLASAELPPGAGQPAGHLLASAELCPGAGQPAGHLLASAELPPGAGQPAGHLLASAELPPGAGQPAGHLLASAELPPGAGQPAGHLLASAELPPGAGQPAGHLLASAGLPHGAGQQPGHLLASAGLPHGAGQQPGHLLASAGLSQGAEHLLGHSRVTAEQLHGGGGQRGNEPELYAPQGSRQEGFTARACVKESVPEPLPPAPKSMPVTFGPPPPLSATSTAFAAMATQPTNGGCPTASGSQAQNPVPAGTMPSARQASPAQWLGQPGGGGQPVPGGDPWTLLVGGINQLQAAMLKQYDGDASPEAVKPGTTSLPSLKPINTATSSVDLQDWLEVIAPAMADISNSSSEWWKGIRQAADDVYAQWARATPMQRLGIQPPSNPKLEEGKFTRINARAASMLMAALDPSISTEMVARRLTRSCTGLVFRLMTLYQPGGEQEKSLVLSHLQSPPVAATSLEAVESLRTWGRWMRRSEAINLMKPDPTILTKGLSSIVQGVLATEYQSNFRTSLVRNSLGVDVSPTYDSVDSYHKHLLAEMEALASGVATGSSTMPLSPATPTTRMKELRTAARQGGGGEHVSTSPSTSPTTRTEADKASRRAETSCRYFGKSQKGCTRGAKCPFRHAWDGVSDRKDRCLACGGKGHMARECPTKKGPPTPSAATRSTTTPSPTSPTTPSARRAVRIDESRNQQVEAAPEQLPAQSPATPSGQPQGQPPMASSGTAAELKEVLCEAGKMLKALTAAQAKSLRTETSHGGMAFLETDKLEAGDEDVGPGAGLLDSGASHPLRAGNDVELGSCTPVTVTLAGDGKQVLAQNPYGTIIIPEAKAEGVQPIVPLGALMTDLGCSLHWTKHSLKLVHPRHGRLKVAMKGRCPELAVTDALRLIQELEEVELNNLKNQVEMMSARLDGITDGDSRTWLELAKEYVSSGRKEVLWKMISRCPYLEMVPEEVKELMMEEFDPDDGMKYLKGLPITRRQRKRLMSSRAWVVHLFSGEEAKSKDPIRMVNQQGRTLIEVDVMNSKLWDMNLRGGVYQLLLWAACTGRVDDVIGGPPCRTFSMLLHRPKQGLPEPARSPEHVYGLPGLDQRRQSLVHTLDSLLRLIWQVLFAIQDETSTTRTTST